MVIRMNGQPRDRVDAEEDQNAESKHSAQLRHAKTDGCFSLVERRTLDLEDHAPVPHDTSQIGRFDSHNIVRAYETNDLREYLDDEIWLKEVVGPREEEGDAQSADSPLLNGTAENMDNAKRKHILLADASLCEGTLESSDEKMKHEDKGRDRYDMEAQQDDLHDRSRADNEDNTSMRSKSTTATALTEASAVKKDSQKSLSRRLSSFFSRSFRRKSRAEAKRVSYSGSSSVGTEPIVHRPGSVGLTHNSHLRPLQGSAVDLVLSPGEELIRLGFSLSILDALKDEPDSFVFVSLSESGFFSGTFNEVEKLSKNESPDRVLWHENGRSVIDATPDNLSSSTPPPHAFPLRSCQTTPDQLAWEAQDIVHSSPFIKKTLSSTMKLDSSGRLPFPHEMPRENLLAKEGLRRLSFMEGTSIMESINHLVYPEENRAHHSSFSENNLAYISPPVGRQAKKLKFKKHPLRWLRSKF